MKNWIRFLTFFLDEDHAHSDVLGQSYILHNLLTGNSCIPCFSSSALEALSNIQKMRDARAARKTIKIDQNFISHIYRLSKLVHTSYSQDPLSLSEESIEFASATELYGENNASFNGRCFSEKDKDKNERLCFVFPGRDQLGDTTHLLAIWSHSALQDTWKSLTEELHADQLVIGQIYIRKNIIDFHISQISKAVSNAVHASNDEKILEHKTQYDDLSKLYKTSIYDLIPEKIYNEIHTSKRRYYKDSWLISGLLSHEKILEKLFLDHKVLGIIADEITQHVQNIRWNLLFACHSLGSGLVQFTVASLYCRKDPFLSHIYDQHINLETAISFDGIGAASLVKNLLDVDTAYIAKKGLILHINGVPNPGTDDVAGDRISVMDLIRDAKDKRSTYQKIQKSIPGESGILKFLTSLMEWVRKEENELTDSSARLKMHSIDAFVIAIEALVSGEIEHVQEVVTRPDWCYSKNVEGENEYIHSIIP